MVLWALVHFTYLMNEVCFRLKEQDPVLGTHLRSILSQLKLTVQPHYATWIFFLTSSMSVTSTSRPTTADDLSDFSYCFFSFLIYIFFLFIFYLSFFYPFIMWLLLLLLNRCAHISHLVILCTRYIYFCKRLEKKCIYVLPFLEIDMCHVGVDVVTLVSVYVSS